MDTDGFIVYVKTDDIYRRCWSKIWQFKYEIDILLPKGKNKIVIGIMKFWVKSKTT